ncbi:helix-turn-helix domain-containing protein [Staphylococcus pasteuri]|uniref:winged helix-turn-helix transcriptional regulator n=1 Tax=Staphylococcus TaxID=1279 RepID=UPI000246349A|nr:MULTISPECIES: helix-turn-helix domain-containing protein [Staphylococcus]ODB33857.1 transcriptional regulator [Staphylococcus sp. AOAB]MBM6508436.1 helix-turn-helix transcriptional regulator [Staphylococcus pasteuri]MCO0862666.1 helix-turn-helix transcriptional regulator [Staphylococcus pasteuri]MCT1927647.1 helix-turn-helix transcriptional regulator [Staphylococcus pasteuri]QDW85666.1 transcriptional regulator [Staphylococcus pasteuri]
MLIEYNNKEFYTSKDLALSVIGGRWKIAIVYHLLQNNRLRLSELQNKLPDINQRMLIRQLRELEKDKIIERKIYQVVPPKVDYRLTKIGLKLDKVVFSICNWGDDFLDILKNSNHR